MQKVLKMARDDVNINMKIECIVPEVEENESDELHGGSGSTRCCIGKCQSYE